MLELMLGELVRFQIIEAGPPKSLVGIGFQNVYIPLQRR